MRMARMSPASIASTLGRSLTWVKARLDELDAQEAQVAAEAVQPVPEPVEEEGGEGVVLRSFHLWEGGFGAAIQQPCGRSVFVPTGDKRLAAGSARDVELVDGQWALRARRPA
jgi:hypothetical protein